MIVKLYSKNNSQRTLDRITSVLQDGGIIVYPTDTTYALGCSCLKERAVERICELKGVDPAKHYLSIVGPDLSHISEYAKVDNATFKLLKRHTPDRSRSSSTLTAICPRSSATASKWASAFPTILLPANSVCNWEHPCCRRPFPMMRTTI